MTSSLENVRCLGNGRNNQIYSKRPLKSVVNFILALVLEKNNKELKCFGFCS